MTVKSDVLGFEGTAKNADRLYPQLHGAGLNKIAARAAKNI
mgnify:CR=1 FL=1